MAPLDPDKYLKKLHEFRKKHAMEALTRPSEISEKNYAFACGFQSGLNQAEKLLNEVLTDLEKDFQ